MAKAPTIWAALAARLGREPTHAEACAEVRRILQENAMVIAERRIKQGKGV
jgi:hypothetical protein